MDRGDRYELTAEYALRRKAPLANMMLNLALSALEAFDEADDRETWGNLYALSGQLAGTAQRGVDIDKADCHLVIEQAWKAELARERRVSR